MSASPKKNTDNLNTVGIIGAGATGAILVYVSIVLLQAFYMNDSSKVDDLVDNSMADLEWRNLRDAQVTSLDNYAAKGTDGKRVRVPVERAAELVLNQLKAGNSTTLVPSVGPSDKPSLMPDGRTAVGAPAPAPTDPATLPPGTTPATPDGTSPANPTDPAVPGTTPGATAPAANPGATPGTTVVPTPPPVEVTPPGADPKAPTPAAGSNAHN